MSRPDVADHVEWAKALAFGPPLTPAQVHELIGIAADPGDVRAVMAIYTSGFAAVPSRNRRQMLGARGCPR